ncbi:MAG: hypothetical protein PR2021_2470 [Candidatus Phytoplasma pruni]|nr:MAG: hypothetical protein PR2021_2470 [Candidatus Phytoplasma pruni]
MDLRKGKNLIILLVVLFFIIVIGFGVFIITFLLENQAIAIKMF